MNSHSSPARHRFSASLTGIFYILATVTSIVAFVLYGPLLQHTDHLSADTVESRQIGLAAIIDCFSIVTVAGTAIMLFPICGSTMKVLHSDISACGYWRQLPSW